MIIVPPDKPTYRLLSPFFGPNDHLYEEGDVIVFGGCPNEDMEPLNEPARAKLRAYVEALDAGAKALAEKSGRSFFARPRNIDQAMAQASADARAVQLNPGGPGVPLQGARKDPGLIEKLGDEEVPETGKTTAGAPRRGRPPARHDLTA